MSFDFSIGTVLILAVGIVVYFIPNWIASARKHHNANAIFMTNLLLGWTVIGWVASLIWALTAVKAEPSKSTERLSESQKNFLDGPSKQCPFCAENIKKAAKVCRYCGRDLPS